MNIPLIKFTDGLITFLNDAGYGSIDHLKLQKLIHIIHYLYIKKFNVNDLIDEMPEKWASGYIYRNIYNKYNNDGEIKSDERNLMLNTNINDEIKELISDVVMMYIHKNTFDLVRISNTLNINELIPNENI